jgi:hypothetical protein
MSKRKSHALWNDNTLELPATITVTKPDRTVRNGSQFLRQEHNKLEKEVASTKISANKSNTKCEEQRQQITDLAGLEKNKRHTLAELMKQVKTVESDIETTSTNRTNKQSTIEGLTKEASANTKEWEDMKSTTEVKAAELAEKELEEETAEKAYKKSTILIEAHRDIGLAFTSAMKTYFEYEWEESNVSLSSTIGAILYVFFDLPFFFSKVELETLLGCAPGNVHVTGTLNKMLEKAMIVKQRESNGTIEYYYLGLIANQMLQRHVVPVIGVIPGVYRDSITIRKRRGREEIGKQNFATLSTTRTDSPSKKEQSSNNPSKSIVIENSGVNDEGEKTNSVVGKINDGLLE